MPKYRKKIHNAQARMDAAKQKMGEEKETSRTAAQEVNDLISWADAFDEASILFRVSFPWIVVAV